MDTKAGIPAARVGINLPSKPDFFFGSRPLWNCWNPDPSFPRNELRLEGRVTSGGSGHYLQWIPTQTPVSGGDIGHYFWKNARILIQVPSDGNPDSVVFLGPYTIEKGIWLRQPDRVEMSLRESIPAGVSLQHALCRVLLPRTRELADFASGITAGRFLNPTDHTRVSNPRVVRWGHDPHFYFELVSLKEEEKGKGKVNPEGLVQRLMPGFDTGDHAFSLHLDLESESAGQGIPLEIRVGDFAHSMSLTGRRTLDLPLPKHLKTNTMKLLTPAPGRVRVYRWELVRSDLPPGKILPEWNEALTRFSPGILRGNFLTSVDSLESYLTDSGRKEDLSRSEGWLSLVTFLKMCQTYQATPYLVLPSFQRAGDLRALAEYLGAPPNIGFGRLRASDGRVEPWTKIFPKIRFEISTQDGNSSLQMTHYRRYLQGSPHLKDHMILMSAQGMPTPFSLESSQPSAMTLFPSIPSSGREKPRQNEFLTPLSESMQLFSDHLAYRESKAAAPLFAASMQNERTNHLNQQIQSALERSQSFGFLGVRFDPGAYQQSLHSFLLDAFWLTLAHNKDLFSQIAFGLKLPSVEPAFLEILPGFFLANDKGWEFGVQIRRNPGSAYFLNVLLRTSVASQALKQVQERNQGIPQHLMSAFSEKIVVRSFTDLPPSLQRKIDLALAKTVTPELIRLSPKTKRFLQQADYFLQERLLKAAGTAGLFRAKNTDAFQRDWLLALGREASSWRQRLEEENKKLSLLQLYRQRMPHFANALGNALREQKFPVPQDGRFYLPACSEIGPAIFGQQDEIRLRSYVDQLSHSLQKLRPQASTMIGRELIHSKSIVDAMFAANPDLASGIDGAIGEFSPRYEMYDPSRERNLKRDACSARTAFSALDQILLARTMGLGALCLYQLGNPSYGYGSHQFMAGMNAGAIRPIALTRLVERLNQYGDGEMLRVVPGKNVRMADFQRFLPSALDGGRRNERIPLEEMVVFRKGNGEIFLIGLNRSLLYSRKFRVEIPRTLRPGSVSTAKGELLVAGQNGNLEFEIRPGEGAFSEDGTLKFEIPEVSILFLHWKSES